jgi:hypothetical protein
LKKLAYIFLFFSSFSIAQIGGQSVFSFLQVPVPARTAALGGSTIGLKDDDISLVLQNPAALNKTMSNKLQMSYINYVADINFINLQYARSFDSIGHFGIALQNVNYGKFIENDEYGLQQGTFTANDYNLTLSYGNELDSVLSWGINLKTIFSKFYVYSSYGNAIDAGITYKNKKRDFVIALLLSNYGYQWKSYSGNQLEKITPIINVGISKKLSKAPIRFLFNYENVNKWDLTYVDPTSSSSTIDPFTGEEIKTSKFRTTSDKLFRHFLFGAELSAGKNFQIRMGYNYRRRKEMQLPDNGGMVGISLGFGVRIKKIYVNYAFTKYHTAGNTSHISISTNLSSF